MWILALGDQIVKPNFDIFAEVRVLTSPLCIYRGQDANFVPG